MSRSKKADEFIGMNAVEASSDDGQSEDGSEIAPIGLEDEASDDGAGLYSDYEGEEYDGEFSDGDPNELAQEGDEDEDEEGEEGEKEEGGDEDDEEDDEEDQDDDAGDSASKAPIAKKAKIGGLGALSRKLAALEEEIAGIEQKQVSDKHWTLTGEVSGKSRPLNSVLEANIELPFGHMSMKRLDDSRELLVDENDFDPENPEKPKFDIELIIRQRVADRTYDDVLRKKVEVSVHLTDQKPTDSLEGIDFEKSQLGLAEVYAQQYEKDIFNQSASSEKVNAEREAAKNTFAKLMHKLDCLTNFNFAPKPPTIKKAGADGIKDLPAMKLEEPIPLIISSSIRANI